MGGWVSQGVLVVKGVRADGQRELLAVDVADSESEATYDALFRKLKGRGLHGVQLVTSDDRRGWWPLFSATSRAQPGSVASALPSQRARQGGQEAPGGAHERPEGHLRRARRDWALSLAREVVERWGASHPAVAEWIETKSRRRWRVSRSRSLIGGASAPRTALSASIRN